MNRVLIVDDNPENLYMLRVLLQGHGYVVEEARNGVEALLMARQSPPALVISDLLMPVMDGYTLLKNWRADDRLKIIPFVVFTATYTDPKDERLALNLGADAFIIKPAEPEPFIARISKCWRKKERGELPPGHEARVEDQVIFKQYSEVLVRKLEDKAVQLEHANRACATTSPSVKPRSSFVRPRKWKPSDSLAGGVAHDFNNLLTSSPVTAEMCSAAPSQPCRTS